MKLLFIGDDHILIDNIRGLLGGSYTIDYVATGHGGIEAARLIDYGLILLSLKLPDIDGLEVCLELRGDNVTAPIIVLSGRKNPPTVVKLLNCGADDYVIRPFNGEVLKARVAALLRRGRQVKEESVIVISDMAINTTRREVQRAGIVIFLRRKEFDILEYLVSNQGKVLSREMILDHVWKFGTEGLSNTVDVHIKCLRDKVDRPFKKPLIKTAYNVGYLIDDKPSSLVA